MSSMHRKTTTALLALLAFSPALAHAQDAPDDMLMGEDGRQWDQARASLKALPPGDMAMAIERWKLLTQSAGYGFNDYASFLMAYPGLPDEAKLRGYAEGALARDSVPPQQVVAFFDKFPPLTNPGRAHYALALYAMGRPQAAQVAREAWRGGVMSDTSEAALLARIGPSLTQDDHDTRMDALLWAGANAQADRQVQFASPGRRATFNARLAMLKGQDPAALAITPGPEAAGDAGYVYNRSRYLRTRGQSSSAAQLLINRPRFANPVREPRKWVGELLAVARNVDAATAVSVAASADDMFAPGTDVSRQSFAVRDDYTSLMWLGGTKALWTLRDGRRAAPLFYKYGMAARTPQTRSKGFYWAGRALATAGDAAGARQYFELAAAYPDQYYGMLALERLGRPLPPMASAPSAVPTAAQRAEFEARPLTRAVREVARESDWPVAVRFFKEIAEQADSEADHVMVADLARQIGRRDLGVILGQAAHVDGHGNFRTISFPLIPVPQGTNWTVVHMITRQESQFAQNAISHAGARGLMQLMPGTAREQAGKMGLGYERSMLISDANYNILLGNGYFMRMLAYYNGCWPLAIAAYNAGPGNVNKWLRQNGDPRNGGIDWVEWIEKIPISETRGYVQRVLENAVVYEALYPQRASYRGPNPLSHYLGKPYPG